ncbi:hypothetical protein DL98DRAFT_136165 [Cadophora sp. DSE1049]|nr:hypothetical protein DL98DRAFT_136165 [Cadophora sp. DSE1049]
MPGQGTFIAASTSTEQSRSDSAGNSPQSITSSPAESTTSQSSAIDCMWPQCNKSFPTRAAYK